MNSSDAILIAGGYGVVGGQLANLIRCRYPSLPLILAGRNPQKAAGLVSQLTNAEAMSLDMERPAPLKGLKPRAIVAVVNDPKDYLLLEAAQNGIPYLDITRWTERVRAVSARISTEKLSAPVILSSGWMAGVAALVSASLACQLKTVDRIEINVLYSLKDKAGPNSAEYMDRLSTPFQIMLEGQPKLVYPYTDPIMVTFPGGYQTKTWRFDTPDQFSLPETTGARTVAARIAFDDAFSTKLLVFLARSGIWKMLSGERFASFRRSVLYNPGTGASHEMVIDVAGQTENGSPRYLRARIADPLGQTHLTAAGALIQLERLIGLDNQPRLAPGLYYPETAANPSTAIQTLKSLNISFDVSQV